MGERADPVPAVRLLEGCAAHFAGCPSRGGVRGRSQQERTGLRGQGAAAPGRACRWSRGPLRRVAEASLPPAPLLDPHARSRRGQVRERAGPILRAGEGGGGGERWARVGRGGQGWARALPCPAAACCGDDAGAAPITLVPWPQERTELRGNEGGAQPSGQPRIRTPGWTNAFTSP